MEYREYDRDEITKLMRVRRESVRYPGKFTYHNDGVGMVSRLDWHASQQSNILRVVWEEVQGVCIDPGDYYNPPVWEPDYLGTLYVEPKLKYWGKGL